LEDDFVALAGLMMRMFGLDALDRADTESLEFYRNRLVEGPLAALGAPELGVSAHAVGIARRLLTPGGFDSPGEVVVELASAMLLRRSPAALRDESAVDRPVATADTVAVRPSGEPPAPAEPSAQELTALDFTGDPRQAAFTPFFIWHSRHGGKFFVIHEGERLTIGRDPDYADVTLMDPAMSRRHCVISKKEGVIRVEDPGSTNGIFVNGERVTSAEIGPEDSLRVGASRLCMTLTSRKE
jgi:hypothetical protein